MARPDLWSRIKGTISVTTTGPGTLKRLRLTDHKSDPYEPSWRPWDAVTIDAQHLSQVVYAAFNGTDATSTLATAVYDDTRTTYRIQGRTRALFTGAATSISFLAGGGVGAGTTLYVALYRY